MPQRFPEPGNVPGNAANPCEKEDWTVKRRRLVLVGVTAMLMLPWLEAPAAAHDWGCWRQPNRTVYSYNTASNFSQAAAALNEWSVDTILNIVNVNYHTEISVFDGNYGNTGWGGLASIESASGCNILHGHAILNTYYSYTSNGKRGIFCQEVGHLFGLQHSNDGGCMGGGYYYDINTYYTVVSHNINDIAAKYNGVPASTAPGGDEHGEEDSSRVMAVWHDNPRSLAETYDLAAAVVVARVTGIYDAADIVVPAAALESGEHRVPNQRIAMAVTRTVKGDVGRDFELFHTGNREFVLGGDPAYEVGQRYLLFLMARDDGTYRVVSPEGRYQIRAGGKLEPVSEKEFSVTLRGAGLESVLGDLSERRRRRQLGN